MEIRKLLIIRINRRDTNDNRLIYKVQTELQATLSRFAYATICGRNWPTFVKLINCATFICYAYIVSILTLR